MNAAHCSQVHDCRAHSAAVARIDCSTAMKGKAVSAGADGCIRVCNADALHVALANVRVHTGSITSFVCFPDGTMWTGGSPQPFAAAPLRRASVTHLSTAGSDGLVRQWQLGDALTAAGGKGGSRSIDLEGLVIRHR